MKICFKCGKKKALAEFHKHPVMADGHLNKCKPCARADVKNNIEKKKTDPKWVALERARCREKSKRARAAGKMMQASDASKNAWIKRNPEKRKAHNRAAQAVKTGKLKKPRRCQECGGKRKLHKHHEDYSKPLKVVWLCPKCHGKRHWK